MTDLHMPESLLIFDREASKMIHFVGQSNLVQNILKGEQTILPSKLIDMTLWLWQKLKCCVRRDRPVLTI